MYKIVHTSPVSTPFSMRIEKGEPQNCYESGVFASERAARRHIRKVLTASLQGWANEDGGETPFWHYAPSGNVYDPPAWWEDYGFEAVDNGGQYWSIRRK